MLISGNIVTDAFGVVAMVAMTPLITLQIPGVIYRIKDSRRANVSSRFWNSAVPHAA